MKVRRFLKVLPKVGLFIIVDLVLCAPVKTSTQSLLSWER